MKRKTVVCIILGAVLLGSGIAAAIYLQPGEVAEPEEIEGTGKFFGVVSDARTGIPLPDAQIKAMDADNGRVVTVITSEEEGRFGLTLPEGDYKLEAKTAGYVLKTPFYENRQIHVEAGTRYVNARLLLWPQAVMTGRVVANTVGISANVDVTYISDDEQTYHYETVSTDETGAFSISQLHEGNMSIEISADGFAALRLDNIETKAGETVELGDIPMKDGVVLYGTVVDKRSRKPIKDAEISIMSADGQLIEQCLSSNDGNYRLPPLDLSRVTVQVAAEGYSGIQQKLNLSGNSNHEMNLVMRRNSGLYLDVQNQTGRAPENQTLVKITDVTDSKIVFEESLANGQKNLTTLSGGPFLVEAKSPDGLTQQVLRVAAGEDVFIRLKPFARIVGQAKTRDGEPLTDGEYRYSFDPDCNASWSNQSWKSLAGDSHFEINELHEGCYRVELRRKSDNRTVLSSDFRLNNGDVRNLTLQMTEGGVLHGHVISSGEGVSLRASVTIEGPGNRKTSTDNDGYFTFDQLQNEPISIVIRLNREDKEVRFDNIVVKENETLEQTFRVDSPRSDRREQMRQRFDEMRERGEIPTPPWGDGPPPWMNGDNPQPPWGDGKPPWGDGPPPWQNGDNPQPPWGDGPPPWENNNGEMPAPPWGDGNPPWQNDNNSQPPPGDNPRTFERN